MAASIGTVANLWQISELSGPRPTHTVGTTELAIECALVAVNFNDQSHAYAQVDGATFDPTTALTARTGRPCYAFQACCVEAGEDNGVLTGGGPCTSSTQGVIHCHLYVEDYTTEKGNGAWAAAGTWTKDIVFCVTYAKVMR